MSARNGGPLHDPGCLAGSVRGARCGGSCARRAWLEELVPRANARGEVLHQLATWAHEKRVFTDAALDGAKARDHDARTHRWVAGAYRAARGVAEEVFLDVRMTALALAEESGQVAAAPLPDWSDRGEST